MLGSEFYQILKAQDIAFLAPSRAELDVLDFENVNRYLSDHSISKIICCVAYTDVEKAEVEARDLCRKLNVDVISNLLKSKIPIIHFSTDYVFGHFDYGVEISEDEGRNPLNYYGQTKFEAERVLETSSVKFWNIRTSWLFGARGNDFISTICRLSETRDTLKIVDDQISRPTYVRDLAEYVVDNFVKKEQSVGHYHLQNSGDPISWAGFAEYFLKLKGWSGTIEKIHSKEWVSKVERPRNSVLENARLEVDMRDWRDAVENYLNR